MEISKQQLTSIIKNAPLGTNQRTLVEGLINKGYNIEGLDPLTTSVYREQSKQSSVLSGNQFQEQPKSFWGKARDFAASVIGGGKLAEGIGGAIAAPGVQKSLEDAQTNLIQTQTGLLQRLKEQRNNGEDTSKTIDLLKLNQIELERIGDANTDFVDSLPTNKQVVGSATRLAATAAGGALTRGVTKGGSFGLAARGAERAGGLGQGFGVGRATSVGSGIARGAGAGATTGAIEGAIQGAGIAAENETDITRGAITGVLAGGVLGGTIGAITGGVIGRSNVNKSEKALLDRVTPGATDLTPTEYQKALNSGRIQPKTATQPAQYLLSEDEINTARKFKDVITNDPVKTSINITNQIGELDDNVGSFLQQNNGIFNKGELRNSLADALEGVDDITIDQTRLQNAKERIVTNFVDALEKNDMHTLWQLRKEFDSTIESAFRGAPSVQKDIKRALRNAVQEFIKQRTPDSTYSTLMSDMTNLFNLRDIVATKATKERALNAISKWIKDNPAKAKAAGWTAGIAGASILGQKALGAVGGND